MAIRKVVLDTNILVSALWNPSGKPAKIIALVPLGKIIPCYNTPIMEEYLNVLRRARLKFSGSKTDGILFEIARHGVSIVVEASTTALPDESDRKFYDVANFCEAFITGNTKHYPKNSYIVTPSEFLELDFQ